MTTRRQFLTGIAGIIVAQQAPAFIAPEILMSTRKLWVPNDGGLVVMIQDEALANYRQFFYNVRLPVRYAELAEKLKKEFPQSNILVLPRGKFFKDGVEE